MLSSSVSIRVTTHADLVVLVCLRVLAILPPVESQEAPQWSSHGGDCPRFANDQGKGVTGPERSKGIYDLRSLAAEMSQSTARADTDHRRTTTTLRVLDWPLLARTRFDTLQRQHSLPLVLT
jgi:hypothetical protein